MNGVWFAGLMKPQPIDDDHQDDRDLDDDDDVLTIADSCVPRIRSSDSSSRMNTAGMFMIPCDAVRRRSRTASGDHCVREVMPNDLEQAC